MEKIIIQPILKAVAPSGPSLIIDTRESVTPQIETYFTTNFGKDLKLQDRIRSEALEVGDLLFKWNNQDLILIERKTLPDLMSSIKSDGRYREQKKRLKAARALNPGLRVYYLIEGQLGTRPKDRYFTENDRKIAYGASVNTLVRDNIPVIRTESLTDTLRTLGKIWECIQKEGGKLKNPGGYGNSYGNGEGNGNAENPVGYSIPVKTRKGENQSAEWCYLAQLQQIPGVSEDVAEAIAERYANLPALIESYKLLDPQKSLRHFADMPLTKRKVTSTGKVRTVGPALSEKIWKYLGSP